MENIDIARALDFIVPAAKYRGSLTKNNRAAFDTIVWADDRPKPAWGIVQTCMVGPETKYHSWDGSDWTITSEDQTIKDSNEAESLRIDEIKAEQVSGGLKKVSISQALSFIDSKIDSNDDIQIQVDGIKIVLKKMIPFIINGT